MELLISELAEKCGVNKETIRYYERKKLLQQPSRTHSGYRIYSENDVKRIKFIKRLQDLGFSLGEIYNCLVLLIMMKFVAEICINLFLKKKRKFKST